MPGAKLERWGQMAHQVHASKMQSQKTADAGQGWCVNSTAPDLLTEAARTTFCGV